MRIMLKKLTKVLKNVQTEIQIEINNLFKTNLITFYFLKHHFAFLLRKHSFILSLYKDM